LTKTSNEDAKRHPLIQFPHGKSCLPLRARKLAFGDRRLLGCLEERIERHGGDGNAAKGDIGGETGCFEEQGWL
jgi:hypothetical protein